MAVISNIGFSYLLALTAVEKWRAMRGFNPSDSILTNKWFVLLMASIAFVLTIALLGIRRLRIERDAEASERRFREQADRRGLTAEERKLLETVSASAAIKRKEAVFSMMPAFNRGAARVMQQRFSTSKSIEERKKLNATLNAIKEKLGFDRKTYSFDVRGRGTRGLSSRSIPVGKKIALQLSRNGEIITTEAVVIKNDSLEFIVQPEDQINCRGGDVWGVRYCLGGATWQFNVITIAFARGELTLSHTENIRFINKRRFLRVSVSKPAMIAAFPTIINDYDYRGPIFRPGTITELSGPGLAIMTDLDVSSGDRVLVVFELEEGKIVEDIGEVRGKRAEAGSGNIIGVELLGLNDAGVNELVRATNSAAIARSFADAEDQADQHETEDSNLVAEAVNG